MKKVKLKQGTLAWENARATRIGSSEIFDIVKYYATDEELQNCGINSEKFREESPFTTAWALYHKMKDNGIFQRQELPPEFAVYGHVVEPYGVKVLQEGRKQKLKAGEVYASDRLITSLDISGISEDIDVRHFDYGVGEVPVGKRFVCEQKTIMPAKLKKGLPIKYILQAQYQIAMTKADFYILQLMVLENDTPYERGYISGMSKAKMNAYLKDNMTVTHLYFQNNEHLSMLIKSCLDRFFADVDNSKEPTPYIENDKQKNIIESLRANTFYNDSLVLDYNLDEYVVAKSASEKAESARKEVLQRIIETAMKNNASRFKSEDGTTASFSKSGAFLVKESK
jgi:hypothetical protein